MDNTVAKNRFFPRSIQLNLTLDQISIKHVILNNFRTAIAKGLADRAEDFVSSQLNRVQIENWSFETKESGARSQELRVSSSKY